MIFWALLGTIVAVRVRKKAPHGSQGGHHGAQSLPYWSNMSPTFHNLFLSGCWKAAKTCQSDLHDAQMTPNASLRHGKWPKIVSKTCNHRHTHELPSDQRLQKPSISPELPKRKKHRGAAVSRERSRYCKNLISLGCIWCNAFTWAKPCTVRVSSDHPYFLYE